MKYLILWTLIIATSCRMTPDSDITAVRAQDYMLGLKFFKPTSTKSAFLAFQVCNIKHGADILEDDTVVRGSCVNPFLRDGDPYEVEVKEGDELKQFIKTADQLRKDEGKKEAAAVYATAAVSGAAVGAATGILATTIYGMAKGGDNLLRALRRSKGKGAMIAGVAIAVAVASSLVVRELRRHPGTKDWPLLGWVHAGTTKGEITEKADTIATSVLDPEQSMEVVSLKELLEGVAEKLDVSVDAKIIEQLSRHPLMLMQSQEM